MGGEPVRATPANSSNYHPIKHIRGTNRDARGSQARYSRCAPATRCAHGQGLTSLNRSLPRHLQVRSNRASRIFSSSSPIVTSTTPRVTIAGSSLSAICNRVVCIICGRFTFRRSSERTGRPVQARWTLARTNDSSKSTKPGFAGFRPFRQQSHKGSSRRTATLRTSSDVIGCAITNSTQSSAKVRTPAATSRESPSSWGGFHFMGSKCPMNF